jgi:bacterioferritin-associated ferredoxin
MHVGVGNGLDGTAFEMHYQFHKPMIVCLCHPTTDRDIDAIIDDGARTVEEISRRCGAGTGCGACLGELRERLDSKGASSSSCSRDCSSTANDFVSADSLVLGAASRAR